MKFFSGKKLIFNSLLTLFHAALGLLALADYDLTPHKAG
jgi:hypothetical protein